MGSLVYGHLVSRSGLYSGVIRSSSVSRENFFKLYLLKFKSSFRGSNSRYKDESATDDQPYSDFSEESQPVNNNTRRGSNNHAVRFASTVHYTSRPNPRMEKNDDNAPNANRNIRHYDEAQGRHRNYNETSDYSSSRNEYKRNPSSSGSYRSSNEFTPRNHSRYEHGNSFDSGTTYVKQRPFEQNRGNKDFESQTNPSWKSNVRTHLNYSDNKPSYRNSNDSYQARNDSSYRSQKKPVDSYERKDASKDNFGSAKPNYGKGKSFSDESDDRGFNSIRKTHYLNEAGDSSRDHSIKKEYAKYPSRSSDFKNRNSVLSSEPDTKPSNAKESREFNDEGRHTPKPFKNAHKHLGESRFEMAKDFSGFKKTSDGYDKDAKPVYSLKADGKKISDSHKGKGISSPIPETNSEDFEDSNEINSSTIEINQPSSQKKYLVKQRRKATALKSKRERTIYNQEDENPVCNEEEKIPSSDQGDGNLANELEQANLSDENSKENKTDSIANQLCEDGLNHKNLSHDTNERASIFLGNVKEIKDLGTEQFAVPELEGLKRTIKKRVRSVFSAKRTLERIKENIEENKRIEDGLLIQRLAKTAPAQINDQPLGHGNPSTAFYSGSEDSELDASTLTDAEKELVQPETSNRSAVADSTLHSFIQAKTDETSIPPISSLSLESPNDLFDTSLSQKNPDLAEIKTDYNSSESINSNTAAKTNQDNMTPTEPRILDSVSEATES